MLYYLERLRGEVSPGKKIEIAIAKKRRKNKDEEEDSSNVVKELSVRMKRRLGRAPFATISRELERL